MPWNQVSRQYKSVSSSKYAIQSRVKLT